MADNTPSLGELASAGQSMTPIATTAVTDQRDLVRNLNENARFKAENDWRKYQDFQQRLGGLYQNLGEIEKMEVMDEDKAELQKDAAELYRKIAENPKAFTTDMKGWAELNQAYGALASKATESKQNNLFDKANRQFVLQNNDLNSDENKQLIDSYRKMPLGSRQAYNLSLQPVFDANTFANTLKTQIEKDYSPQMTTTQVGFDETTGKPVEGGEGYLREKTVTQIPYKDFITRWDSSLGMLSDKNNQPVKNWAKKQYDTLPADVKQKVSLEQFWSKIGQNLYGSSADEKGNIKDIINVTKDEVKADPNYLKKQTIAQQERDLTERTRHNKAMEAIGWKRAEKDEQEDDDAAQGIVMEISDTINDAMRPENRHEVYEGGAKGNNRVVYDLNDPEVLKKFATLDKDGKTIVQPDVLRIDEKTGNPELVYFEKDDDNNNVKNKTGGFQIKDTKPINERTWSRLKVGVAESAKNKGKVNEKVQSIITKNGGVLNIAKKIKDAEQKQEQDKVPPKGINDYAPDVRAGILKVMEKNNISEKEAIEALRKAGKID